MNMLTALPSAKDEDWRQFPLQKILKKSDFSVISSSFSLGTEIEPLETSLFEGADIPSSLLAYVREATDSYVALDVQKDSAIHLDIDGEAGAISMPHIQIIVRKDCTLDLHETLDTDNISWLCPLIEIVLEEGAKLNFERHDKAGKDVLVTDQLVVVLNTKAEAKLFNAKTDMAKSRFAAHVLCKGEGVRADITGLCLTEGGALAESFIDIQHICAGTFSSQLYHAIVGGKAQSTYTGKVTVAREAQKTDAQQLSRGLLLSPMATNFVKPELEIYADDVQCAHGATTGDLDEEALFYMRSRGLPENEAKRLLIEAFCAAPLSRLREDSLLKEMLEVGLKTKLEALLS